MDRRDAVLPEAPLSIAVRSRPDATQQPIIFFRNKIHSLEGGQDGCPFSLGPQLQLLDGGTGGSHVTGINGWISGSAVYSPLSDCIYFKEGYALMRLDGNNAVTLVAGNSREYGEDDGEGPAARFYWWHSLAYDGRGCLYVLDKPGIRRVQVQVPAGAGGVDPAAPRTASPAPAPSPPLTPGLPLDGAGSSNTLTPGHARSRSRSRPSSVSGMAVNGPASSSGAVAANGTRGAAGVDSPSLSPSAGGDGDGGGASGSGYGTVTTLAIPNYGFHLIAYHVPTQELLATTHTAIYRVPLTGNSSDAPELLAGEEGSKGTADGPGTSARFLEITGLLAAPDGAVYVMDYGRLRRLVVGVSRGPGGAATAGGSSAWAPAGGDRNGGGGEGVSAVVTTLCSLASEDSVGFFSRLALLPHLSCLAACVLSKKTLHVVQAPEFAAGPQAWTSLAGGQGGQQAQQHMLAPRAPPGFGGSGGNAAAAAPGGQSYKALTDLLIEPSARLATVRVSVGGDAGVAGPVVYVVHRAVLLQHSDFFRQLLAAAAGGSRHNSAGARRGRGNNRSGRDSTDAATTQDDSSADGGGGNDTDSGDSVPLQCVDLPDVDPEDFAALLAFMYTGALDVPQPQLRTTTELATRLKLAGGAAALQHRLLDASSPSSVLDDLVWAEQQGLRELAAGLKAQVLQQARRVAAEAPREDVRQLMEQCPDLMDELFRAALCR